MKLARVLYAGKRCEIARRFALPGETLGSLELDLKSNKTDTDGIAGNGKPI